jgi:hypothetical protein
MGLDITAVSRTASHFLGSREQLGDEQYEELLESDTALPIWVSDGHEERLDGYARGMYRVEGQSMGFRAGSYSGYNWWRRHLSLMALDEEPQTVWADPEAFAGEPFVELIDFSDCEGCIGPKTSAKLAKDFRDYAAQAEAYARERGEQRDPNRGPLADEDQVGSWWLESYREWQEAFELASDDGFVKFH